MTEMLTSAQARNVATIRTLYDCERRGDLDGWTALWHADGRQTFPWDDGSHDVIGIDALRASTAHKFATRTNVTIDDQLFPMADTYWLFAIATVSIHFVELGRTLDAELWCRFRFDESGLILEHQEVLDSGRVAALLEPQASDR